MIRILQVYTEITDGRFEAGEKLGAPLIQCSIIDDNHVQVGNPPDIYRLVGIYDASKVLSGFRGIKEIPFVWNIIEKNGRKCDVLASIVDVMRKDVTTGQIKYADFIVLYPAE